MGLWNTAQWSFVCPRANFIITPYPNCCCGSKVSKTKEQTPAPRLHMGKNASIPSRSWKISNSIAWEDQQQACKPRRFSEAISMQQQAWGKNAGPALLHVLCFHGTFHSMWLLSRAPTPAQRMQRAKECCGRGHLQMCSYCRQITQLWHVLNILL